MKPDDLGEKYFWRVRRRLLINNQNWLAVVAGETGSGKSYSAMAMADAISPRGFNVARCLVFNPIQFLQRINHPDDLRKGDILIFDEAGVGMSAREWYSVQNKLLGSVLQTFRNLNVGVIFTVPNLGFIDVQARKLLHAYFETAHIDRKENVAVLRVYEVQHNSRLDKTYMKAPRFLTAEGCLVRCARIGIPKIADEIAAAYEEAKTNYTRALNERALTELTTPKPGRRERLDPEKERDMVEAIKQDRERFRRKRGSKYHIDHALVMREFGVSWHQGRRMKIAAERDLGYDVASQ